MGVTDFLDLCESRGTDIALVVVLLLAVVSLFLPFKDRMLSKIGHKRNRWYFAYGLLYLSAVILLHKINLISFRAACILVLADCLYIAYCVFNMDHCSPIAAYCIHKYEKLLENGLTAEYIGYFAKKHWYICETTDKIAYRRLKARYYADLGQMNVAYKAVGEINADVLYEEEAREFETIKAMLLWHMGDFSAAVKLLENGKHDTNPVKYMLSSFILEFSGNLDGAYEKMKEAKDLCAYHSVCPEYHMQILENFGRIQRLRGNLTEAIQYMHQANKMLEQMKNPRADLQRNIKEGLIFNEALARGDDPYVQEQLNQYKERIPVNSIGNLISYNNCCIEVYRQFGDKKKVYDLIKSGYYDLIGKLDEVQKALYQASTFRMLMNGEYVHDWLDGDIDESYQTYSKLPLPERIIVYKEFAGVFQQQQFYCVRNKKPYRKLWEQIKKYYNSTAIEDIDNYLISLDAYEVYQRGRLLQDKLAILKYLQKDQHIDKSKQIYVDLYNMYSDAGLQIDAVNALMILVDECGSPYNLKIQTNPFCVPVLYQDWIDGAPAGPEPQLLPNGYQLYYFRLQPCIFKVYPLQDKVLEEYLNMIIPIVKGWYDHPAKYEFSLHIAHFLMALNRRGEAKEFYDLFCENKLSIDHYATWMKEDYYALTAEFAPYKLQAELKLNPIQQ